MDSKNWTLREFKPADVKLFKALNGSGGVLTMELALLLAVRPNVMSVFWPGEERGGHAPKSLKAQSKK